MSEVSFWILFLKLVCFRRFSQILRGYSFFTSLPLVGFARKQEICPLFKCISHLWTPFRSVCSLFQCRNSWIAHPTNLHLVDSQSTWAISKSPASSNYLERIRTCCRLPPAWDFPFSFSVRSSLLGVRYSYGRRWLWKESSRFWFFPRFFYQRNWTTAISASHSNPRQFPS